MANYEEILGLISSSIIEFNQDCDSNLSGIITRKTLGNLRVYRKNYFFGSYKRLSSDFPSLCSYCEGDNFRYFVKDFLLRYKILYIDISQLSHAFIDYLEETFEMHQDILLYYIAKLDLLYSYGHFKNSHSIEIPTGLFEYWCFLNAQFEGELPKMDLDLMDTVYVLVEAGERYLGKIK